MVGRATFGVNGGIGLDPELIYLGAQGQFGPIVRNLWFRPNFEFGFGELQIELSLNLDVVYYLPLIARGASTSRQDVWSIYLGGGPAFQLSHRNFEELDLNIDFGDWDYDTGLNLVLGVSQEKWSVHRAESRGLRESQPQSHRGLQFPVIRFRTSAGYRLLHSAFA